MEADNYLSGGYGHLLALRSRLRADQILRNSARIWQPSRLKGTVVGADAGTPFLAATQAFDVRPIPRKFLALERTENAEGRFVDSRTILVTCSGTVGRATIATDALASVLISHDLLRVQPDDLDGLGWLYAYLRAPSVRLMMGAAQYGHIIKHLEPEHLGSLPFAQVRHDLGTMFNEKLNRIVADRNRALQKMREAEALFETAVGLPTPSDRSNQGFSVSSAVFSGGRRRFEASFHNAEVRALRQHFAARSLRAESIRDVGFRTWLPNRFKRVPAEEGVELVGSSDLFEINPDIKKRIVDIAATNPDAGRVDSGWLLLARSGQIYGLNGTLAIANAFHEGKIVSDHVIRLAPEPKCSARAGYIYTALSHPTLGRPLMKALAYGSSIPEIEVADVMKLEVVRLPTAVEDEIADLTETAAALYADADITETLVASEADQMIGRLIDGDYREFTQSAGR